MTSPQRIQLRRTKGWRMPPSTIKVTRPGKYGNPFSYFGCAAIDRVRRFTCETLPKLDLAPLRGKNLACWCKIGEPCHADVLLEAANK
jgi:Domain of unknown function (DUF4326)